MEKRADPNFFLQNPGFNNYFVLWANDVPNCDHFVSVWVTFCMPSVFFFPFSDYRLSVKLVTWSFPIFYHTWRKHAIQRDRRMECRTGFRFQTKAKEQYLTWEWDGRNTWTSNYGGGRVVRWGWYGGFAFFLWTGSLRYVVNNNEGYHSWKAWWWCSEDDASLFVLCSSGMCSQERLCEECHTHKMF